MKEITFYKEISENQYYKSVKEGIGFNIPEKDIILKYFSDNSKEHIAVTCSATDYVTGNPMLGTSILVYSDGIYSWTNEEIYHFDKYDLKLNDDFIEYVLNKMDK